MMKFVYAFLIFFFFSCAHSDTASYFPGIYSLKYFNNDLYLESSDSLYIYANGTYEHILSSSTSKKRVKENFGTWKYDGRYLVLNDYSYLDLDEKFPPFAIYFEVKVNIWGGKYLKQSTNILAGIKYINQP